MNTRHQKDRRPVDLAFSHAALPKALCPFECVNKNGKRATHSVENCPKRKKQLEDSIIPAESGTNESTENPESPHTGNIYLSLNDCLLEIDPDESDSMDSDSDSESEVEVRPTVHHKEPVAG
jgi:hypothetical protein